ncbi:MAG: TauD/TfdA dioxygenase family protein, partial [Rhodospirillales bacterium]
MKVLPSGQACGADITGIDVGNDLDDQTFKQIEDALHDHAVICLRDQHLSDTQQVAFTRKFGEAGANAFSSYGGHTAHPEILIVSNVQQDGKNIGNPNAGLFWHTD